MRFEKARISNILQVSHRSHQSTDSWVLCPLRWNLGNTRASKCSRQPTSVDLRVPCLHCSKTYRTVPPMGLNTARFSRLSAERFIQHGYCRFGLQKFEGASRVLPPPPSPPALPPPPLRPRSHHDNGRLSPSATSSPLAAICTLPSSTQRVLSYFLARWPSTQSFLFCPRRLVHAAIPTYCNCSNG